MINRSASVYWHPLWLRKATLFSFMAIFVILCLGLILIWHIVHQYDGIPLTVTTNHYAWTYGPTAILTIIVSLWRQVNYCTMINQPWHELYNGPQQATKTVLLDYVSPFQLTSFVAALKNRHLAVATTILIFTLLKLVVVISTTLFVLGNSTSSQGISVNLQSKFNASNYLNSLNPENRYIVTSDPVWDYLILREQYRDVAPPVELSTAFTNYSITSKLPEGAGEASIQVDIFQANVTCEVPTVHWSQDVPAAAFNVTLNAPSCNIGTIGIGACYYTPADTCTPTARYFESRSVRCGSQSLADAALDDSPATANDYRQVFIAVESDLSIDSTPTPYSSLFNVSVRRVAAVSCNLEYSINQGIAHGPAFDTSKIDSLQIIEGAKSHINNLTNMQILETVFSSLLGGQTVTGGGPIPLMSSDMNLVGLLADSRSITTKTFDPLLNASLLQSRAEKHIAGLSHQVMRQFFLMPDDTTSSGSVDYPVQKLFIRAASIWAMVGLLATVFCLMVIVIVYTKSSVAPQSPATIATTAYTVSRSPDLGKLLGELSAMRLSEIRKALASYDFVTVQYRAGPRVEAVAVTRQETLPKPPGWLQRKWESISSKHTRQSADLKLKKKRVWMPFSGRGHAISLTMILPTIAIVVLEILWYLSENDERFVTVSSDSGIDAYAVRFGSTATVLAISTLFNALDFTIATMSPFSTLASGGGATPERTLFFTIIGDLPPVALYKAIYHMHWGAALSLVASTVGSLLTVVISGLWFDTAIEISLESAAEVQSGWNINFTANQDPNKDTINFFNELQHGGPDEAELVWSNMVLPEIGNPQPSITSELREMAKNRTLRYSFAVPAIRPYLECTMLPQSAIAVNDSDFAQPDNPAPVRKFTITTLLPAGCNSSSPADPSGIISFYSYHAEIEGKHATWFGALNDLKVKSISNSTPSEGCPSLGAIFGTYEHADLQLQPQSNLTALLCTQYIQSVEANTFYPGSLSTLSAPNITADVHLNSPPINIIDVRSGSSSISTLIADPFGYLDLAKYSDNITDFDQFFGVLTSGPGGTDREQLIGSGNVDTLISAMNGLYQNFMVHVIDREYRSTIGGRNSTLPIPNGGVVKGTMTISVSRLKINRTSKIILQAFLSTMVVFGGLAWWCVDLRVLPRNPYPIASSMALLGGSRLVRGSSQAASGSEDQERPMTIRRKPLVVMKGKRFRLGWWEDPNAEADNSDPESDSTSEVAPSLAGRRFGIDVVEDTDKAASSTALETSAVYRRRWFRWHQ
ncbi:hypothetical protein F4782DRAFT_494489 [Xylaria castorea]|nr:hypothetical protein F4782DRAFT_494489 [Xylaria castorea]